VAVREIRIDDREIDLLLDACRSEPQYPGVYRILDRLRKAKKPKIKVSSAKAKGRNLQKYVCEELCRMLRVPFDNKNDNCAVHSREMGQRGTDIVLRGDAYKRIPYDIECKAQETLGIPEWIKQARANKSEDRDWLLVIKKQSIGSTPIVCMDWSAFSRLLALQMFVNGRGAEDV
jgi:hypothetical protein